MRTTRNIASNKVINVVKQMFSTRIKWTITSLGCSFVRWNMIDLFHSSSIKITYTTAFMCTTCRVDYGVGSEVVLVTSQNHAVQLNPCKYRKILFPVFVGCSLSEYDLVARKQWGSCWWYFQAGLPVSLIPQSACFRLEFINYAKDSCLSMWLCLSACTPVSSKGVQQLHEKLLVLWEI